MTIKCCVYTCANKYKVKGLKVNGDENNVIFHRFPREAKRKAIWVNNIRKINGYTWEPKHLSFICSEHFDRFSWEVMRKDGKRKLKVTASPTVFNHNHTATLKNDHTYSRQMPLQDISNKSDIITHVSIYCHTLQAANSDHIANRIRSMNKELRFNDSQSKSNPHP